MASSMHPCGPCDIQHITKQSIVWCTECEEGLCPLCLKHHTASKASRNHNTMSITEYQELPSDVKKFTENCDKHNEKYTIFCRKHECPCCGGCVVEDHIDCRDFSRLKDIIDKTKTSEALDEIEKSLLELAENIQRIRQNRENNLKTLSEQKIHIEQKIKNNRAKINSHLDKLQDAIMETLNTAEEKERREISLSLTLLDGKGAEIFEYQRKIKKIKEHATNLQTFFSIKLLENEVSCNNTFLQSMVDKENLKESELSYHANAVIENCDTDINTFGVVTIEKKACEVILAERKDKQAQTLMPRVSNRAVEHINLKLHKTVNGIGSNIWGCCMLPDERMVFAYYGLKILKVFNTEGSNEFKVKIPSFAFDVAYISEDDTLAVTSGVSGSRCITIVDIQHKKIKKTIKVDSDYYGITVKDKKFICSESEKGIQLFNPYDNSSSELVRDNLPTCCYVAHFEDTIYYTNVHTHVVTSYDMHGSIQWKFKNESVLNCPHGISVDNDGNVFVVGKASNNVVVISADGQHHKVILTASDGLSSPYALDYDRSTNQLLVANGRNIAMVFTLI